MLRKTAHAGSFYPRFAEQINAQIAKWTAGQAQAPDSENVIGIIVPHAGYIYSGECAARAYHYISAQHFDTLVVLHPSHHGGTFDWAVSPFEQYESPLGILERDERLAELLAGYGGATVDRRYHEAEHSMEIQLPLIRHFFPEARVCPVMIGRYHPEVAQNLALALRGAIAAHGRKVAVVVSTDLSHYYNSDRAERMDGLITRFIMSLDPDSLWQSVVSKRCEACGIGGVLSLIYYAGFDPEAKAKVIQYTHSGKVTGDNQQVVGYLSAVVYA